MVAKARLGPSGCDYAKTGSGVGHGSHFFWCGTQVCSVSYVIEHGETQSQERSGALAGRRIGRMKLGEITGWEAGVGKVWLARSVLGEQVTAWFP
jgi:hypothetical protein